MNRKNAFNILKINVKYKELNDNLLKKYYRISCLKTHPDKNGCNDAFLKVKEAYEFLKEDLLINKYETKTETNDETNEETKQEYNKEINQEYNEIYKLIIDYIEILKPIYYYFMKKIELNPTLINLFKKDMFFLKEYNVYIPLWHKEIVLFDKINIIINPSIPENVTIDEDNNIYIKIDKFTETYTIGNISFLIPLYEDKKYFKGIPKINEKNIYDITTYSDLIFIRE